MCLNLLNINFTLSQILFGLISKLDMQNTPEPLYLLMSAKSESSGTISPSFWLQLSLYPQLNVFGSLLSSIRSGFGL